MSEQWPPIDEPQGPPAWLGIFFAGLFVLLLLANGYAIGYLAVRYLLHP